MTDQTEWGQPINPRRPGGMTASLPLSPPDAAGGPPGLTVEVMSKLDGGRSLEPRSRITNTATFVLGTLAVLVATFSAGAWVGRENAPAAKTTSTNAGPAAALAALAGTPSGATGGGGRLGRAGGFSGASGLTGASGGAGGAGGLPAAAGTAGTVKLVDGANVYITTAQGTVVKVTTNAQSQVAVSKQGSVADLAVGETVIVQGDTAADGTIAATTIRAGTAGGGGAFGGGQRGASGATGAPATGATGGR